MADMIGFMEYLVLLLFGTGLSQILLGFWILRKVLRRKKEKVKTYHPSGNRPRMALRSLAIILNLITMLLLLILWSPQDSIVREGFSAIPLLSGFQDILNLLVVFSVTLATISIILARKDGRITEGTRRHELPERSVSGHKTTSRCRR